MMTESEDVPQGVGHGVRNHGWTHVLTELMSMEDLSVPLRGSARLRYTCISVSRRYIALGANTGAVYIFGRESLKHLQVVLAEKESSSVTQVCFGPIDNVLGYACSNGNVFVVELNIEKRSKPERVRLSVEHSGSTVTGLHWDTTGGRLFSGDNLGKISVAFVQSSKAKDLFQHPSEGIVRLDSAIVQLGYSADRLLVSTVTRCYLCYTSRQQYSQIGKRLRDGQFGACFYPGPDRQTTSIYCARPGSRVWEVDFDGNVLNTHQFKQLLAIPSFPVISCRSVQTTLPDNLEIGKAQSVAFPKLLNVSDTFLFTWSQNGLYVLDPVAVKVITWCKYSAGMVDVKCYKNEVYIFTEASGQVQKLLLLPIQRCVSVLILKEYWSLAGQLCAYFDHLLVDSKSRRCLPYSTLKDLYQQLLRTDEMDLASKVKVVLSAIEALPDDCVEDDIVGIVRLDSGIYQVNDGRKMESDDDSPHTPSSVRSLSRHSSTSSLHTLTTDQLSNMSPKRASEATSTEVNSASISTVSQLSEHSGLMVNLTDLLSGQSDNQQKVDSPVTNGQVVNGNNINQDSQSMDAVMREHEVTDSKSVAENRVTSAKETSEIVTTHTSEQLNYDVTDSSTDTPTPVIATESSVSDDQISVGAHMMRKGSTSSLSSLSSNDLVMDQVISDPIAVAAGRSDSGKKSGRKKKATTPVIQSPGAKVDGKAKSDLGPTAAIQEAILEVDKQETVSADTDNHSQEQILDQINVTLPTVPYSSWMVRSSSPIISQESSPSQSPLVQSWEGSPNSANISGPKTALKSVKESLSSKLSSTRKNLIRTIREKKTKFASRDSSPVFNQPREEIETEHRKWPSETVIGSKEAENWRQTPAEPDEEIEDVDELTPLRQATRTARAKLQQTDTLLQPHAVLSTWLKQLHLALQKLHTTHGKEQPAQICPQSDKVAGSESTMNTVTAAAGRNDRESSEVTVEPEQAISNTHADLSSEIGRDVMITGMNGNSDETDSQVISETVESELQSDIPTTQSLDKEEDSISSDQYILPVKDSDTVSVDSGHPVMDGQNEDTSSDLDVILSNDPVENAVPDKLTISDTDHSIPVSSYSSGTSESFAESPSALIGEFKPQDIPDSHQQTVKPNIKSAGQDREENELIKQCHITHPFPEEQSLTSDISYLANICFELGLHGRVSDYIMSQKNTVSTTNTCKTDSDTKHSNSNVTIQPGSTSHHQNGQTIDQQNDQTVDQTVDQQNDQTIDQNNDQTIDQQNDQTIDQQNDQTIDQKNDQRNNHLTKDEEDNQLALFLRNYFSYLDIATVTKSLNSASCHGYQTWIALLDCFREKVKGDSICVRLDENNTTGAFDLLRSGIGCDPPAILGHLPRLFTVSPNKTLEFCLEEVKYSKPLDILFLCRLLNKPLQDLFLPYMLARYSAMNLPGQLAVLCEHSDVRLTWLRALMQQEEMHRLKTPDSLPLAGSHLYPWKHKSVINSILDQFISEDSLQMLEICQEFGYWLGSLQLLHHLEMRKKGLEMIVRLGDITLLASDAWFPVNVEEWQCVLDTMISLQEVSVSDSNINWAQVTPGAQKPACSPSLTWDSLGLVLAESLGAERAISLLQALPLPPDALSLKFHQGLIVTTIGAQRKRSLLHNILEKTDAYLWAKKPTQMAPQLHYAAEEERKMVTAVREGRHTQVFKDMFTQLESQADIVSHRFVEDPECHWGVRCDFNRNCPCCGLELTAQVSVSQPGVLIFPCGHGYHKFCHTEKVCQVCNEN